MPPFAGRSDDKHQILAMNPDLITTGGRRASARRRAVDPPANRTA
jgi:hypothetical protein